MPPINNEILEGLKHSIARGESLQQASMTFKNAGYPDQEVDEAVKALKIDVAASQGTQTIRPVQQTTQIKKAPPQQRQTSAPPVRKVTPQRIYTPTRAPMQQVSSYAEEPRENSSPFKGFIIILVILLIILIGSLVALFIFKDSIIDYLSTLFSK